MVEEARRITIRDLLEKRKRRGKRAKRWAFRVGALGKQQRSRIGWWRAEKGKRAGTYNVLNVWRLERGQLARLQVPV